MKTPVSTHESRDRALESRASAIDTAAAHWLARLTSGETSAAERSEFDRWRRADPAHEAALAALRGLWSGIGVSLQHAAPLTPIAAPRSSRRRRAVRWALAASVLIGVALSAQVMRDAQHDLVTAIGEQRSATLADGSTVILSSGTALDVRFANGVRRATLARGEAFFEIRHDAAHPFTVDAGDCEVRVLGTRFSVRRDGDRTRVVVVDGRVEVRNGSTGVVLGADQRIDSTAHALSAIAASDPNIELAWRHRRLIVQHRPLAEVATELGRYDPAYFVVASHSAGQRRIDAVIDLDHIDDWLTGLDQSRGIDVMRIGSLVIIR